MELYIGGYAQGKLEYVLSVHPEENIKVIDCGSITEYQETTEETVKETAKENMGMETIIFDQFHLWIKKLLEEGKNPEKEAEKLLKIHQNCIIISDEIGNGIVPTQQSEREYRERLGRIQIELAKRAERVERIICGIGQRLK